MVLPSMDSPAWMFTKALSHRQKVMRLYKRCIREVDAWHGTEFLEKHFQRVLMRARFDANKDVTDMRLSQYLLADGCRQLWQNRHVKPVRFANDPLGSNYDREMEADDMLLEDNVQWTWAEKEQFPYYFNRREKRKKELMAHWHKIEAGWDAELDAIQRELPKGGENSGKQNGGVKGVLK